MFQVLVLAVLYISLNGAVLLVWTLLEDNVYQNSQLLSCALTFFVLALIRVKTTFAEKKNSL